MSWGGLYAVVNIQIIFLMQYCGHGSEVSDGSHIIKIKINVEKLLWSKFIGVNTCAFKLNVPFCCNKYCAWCFVDLLRGLFCGASKGLIKAHCFNNNFRWIS